MEHRPHIVNILGDYTDNDPRFGINIQMLDHRQSRGSLLQLNRKMRIFKIAVFSFQMTVLSFETHKSPLIKNLLVLSIEIFFDL